MSEQTPKFNIDRDILKKGSTIILIVMTLLILFFWIVQGEWSYRKYSTDVISPRQMLPWMNNGDVIEQRLSIEGDAIDSIYIYPFKTVTDLEGILRLDMLADGNSYYSQEIPLSAIMDQLCYEIVVPGTSIPLKKNVQLTMRLTYLGSRDGVFTIGYGSTIDLGKLQAAASSLDGLTYNGQAVTGRLTLIGSMHAHASIILPYLVFSAGLLLMISGIVLYMARKKAQHKHSILLVALELVGRYWFLMQQLVARDFNTKYRRSVLGVVWSFLNPLLTMAVQYLVFSTLFKNDIENFPVYLMTGIVFFNFFSESVSLGLESIVNSASLISKVYIPKVIFPISRVFSSLINLAISLVPLIIMIAFTGMPIHRAILLLPLVVILLMFFSCGISFLLATANVFFRDTRFLWGVIILLWTYMTPIFYPESIIPVRFISLYHLNPMYQFLTFLRSITLGGVTPLPVAYLNCLLAALIPFLLGLWVFRKNQSKFILYL